MVGLCRLCAAVRKTDVLIPMANDVCRKLRLCFAMEMCQPGDKLPNHACAICVDTLQNTCTFLEKVQESQELLTLLFDEPKQKSNHNIGEVCKRFNGEIDAKYESKAVYPNIITQGSVNSNETNDASLATSDTMQFNVEILEEEGSDKIEVYQDDTEDDLRVERIAVESDLKGGENNSPPLESCTDVEVENYYLEEEDFEDLGHGHEPVIALVEQTHSEKDEIVTEGNLKPTVIEILRLTNDHNRNSKIPEDFSETQQIKWISYTWICYACSETCNNFSALLLHCQEKHHVIKASYMKYNCADCHKIIANYHKFLNHVRFRHQPKLSLRCDACDVHQESYTQLALHRDTACEAAKTYPSINLCSICGKSFQSRNATLMHARAQHNDDKNYDRKCHQCAQCEKKFKRMANLRAHENIHSGLKEFPCNICDRKFRQKHSLELHLHTHVNNKAYECKVCNKSLKTSVSLEKHQLIHNNIKKFLCDYCDKNFRTKDEKLSHERIHTGEKPYKCSYCDRSFRFRSILMGHIIGHTGVRPYSCQDCNRQFSNWGNMNKHITRCHKRDSDGKGTQGERQYAKPTATHGLVRNFDVSVL